MEAYRPGCVRREPTRPGRDASWRDALDPLRVSARAVGRHPWLPERSRGRRQDAEMDDGRPPLARVVDRTCPSFHQPRTAVRESPRLSVTHADRTARRPARGVLEPAECAHGRRDLWRARCVGLGRRHEAADGPRRQRDAVALEAGADDAGGGANASRRGSIYVDRLLALAAGGRRPCRATWCRRGRALHRRRGIGIARSARRLHARGSNDRA